VDDGVATGGTARAAVQTVRARGAAKVVVAVPVGAAESIDELARVADEVVCPHPQEMLLSVGHWYEDFRPISDEDVVELLRRARSRSERVPLYLDRDVRIPAGDQELAGRLTIPSGARGLVLFAHGSGSGRRSPRNQYVAGELQSSGLATLLFDLLSEEESALEERTERLRFDVDALANRLVDVTDWAHAGVQTGGLDVGYFGASTGAAAALIAATARPLIVSAVVSRGGRPDLAGTALSRVRAPTLLLVGGADRHVLNLNREALFHLTCDKQLVVVPGATHLFPEPGALEQVAGAAARWFVRHLGHHAFVASA
jgi:putative phosphoribosyl transferase